MYSQIKARLLGPLDLLREAWNVYRGCFRDILIVVLFVYVPLEVLLAFVPLAALRQQYGSYGLRVYDLIARVLEFVIGTVATLALASITAQRIEEERLTWSAALGRAVHQWPEAFLTGLLGGLILLGLTVLLVIPGVIFSVYYLFWVYAVALRGHWGREALNYSKQLVQGQWWRVCAIELVLGLAALVVGLVISSPAELAPSIVWLPIVLNLLTDVAAAYFTVAGVLFFLNNDYVYPRVRQRRERLRAIQE